MKVHGDDKIGISLIKKAASGDRESAEFLLRLILPRVRNTLRYFTGNDADTDDLTQISLLEVLRFLNSYSGEGSFLRWVDTIVIRNTYRYWRQKKKRLSHEAEMTEKTNGIVSLEGLNGEGSEKLEMRRKLSIHLSKLSMEQKEAIILKLAFGYRVEEIAEMTETSINTVKKRLMAGRKKLRELVMQDETLMKYIR